MTILREITGNGKSVHRVFRKGLLTLSETSNEWPIHRVVLSGSAGSTFILKGSILLGILKICPSSM